MAFAVALLVRGVMRLVFLLLFLVLESWASMCPPPLPARKYRTKCTGKSVVLDGEVYPDCSSRERPARRMDPRLVSLIEKLRCKVGNRISINSGYRSRKHNLFLWAVAVIRSGDEARVAKGSKHQTGRAVDFSIRGETYHGHKIWAKKMGEWAKSNHSPHLVWARVYPAGMRSGTRIHHPYIHLEIEE